MAEAVTQKVRTAKKTEYRIQLLQVFKVLSGIEEKTGSDNYDDPEDGFLDLAGAPSFSDTASALKHVRENEIVGDIRIVRVCKSFSSKKHTKVVMKIE